MSAASKLLPITVKFAKKFLQTAVLIDDRAYETDAAVQAEGGLTKPGRFTEEVAGPILKQEDGAGDPSLPVADSHRLDVRNVVAGFAQDGIVCSVLKPERDESLTDADALARKLSTASDILIVDWSLHNDGGERALDLLQIVVQTAFQGSPSQLRLVVVYTAENDLRAIADTISARLKTVTPTEFPLKNEELTIAIGSIRIAIFAKDGIKETKTIFPHRVVRFDELSHRVISEFADMTNGIVPSVMLDALSEVRRNTGRLLGSLSNVDAPFLTHRALSIYPPEADEHLLDLISDEIKSVLSQVSLIDHVNEETIKYWFEDALSAPGSVAPNTKGIDALSALTQLCCIGKSTEKLEEKFGQVQWSKQLAKGNKLSSKDVRDMARTIACQQNDGQNNQKLAMLMSLRTFYGDRNHILINGVIVSSSEEEKSRYWICLQPRCDSVRLQSSRSFPLLELDFVASENDKFHLSIPDGDKPSIRLSIQYKPYKCRMETFSPNNQQIQAVIAEFKDNSYLFASDNGRVYKWIAELKIEQAQRISNKFSAELARVGLTESEWLRRMA